jgi:hypothetical protein
MTTFSLSSSILSFQRVVHLLRVVMFPLSEGKVSVSVSVKLKLIGLLKVSHVTVSLERQELVKSVVSLNSGQSNHLYLCFVQIFGLV